MDCSSALSVGFARTNRDVFERPRRRGGLPVVRPRGIQVVECSLVMWGAYSRAGITSLPLRSAADQERHEESERTIVETQRFLAEFAVRRAQRRAH
jgi:hypothetical protein